MDMISACMARIRPISLAVCHTIRITGRPPSIPARIGMAHFPFRSALQHKPIDAMKKMGTVVGSVKLEEGVIGIDSFYEQAKPAA